MPNRKSSRGRKPDIQVAAKKLHEIRRTCKALVTELSRLEDRLNALDAFYRRNSLTASAQPSGSRPGRSRGPNVRDLAHNVLSKNRRGLPISDLSEKVATLKGGQVGAKFTLNLAAALMRDSRFRRMDRGVYGLR